ncbi:MAG: zinc dependent phospholipase C family protein, partial [Candidatus Riflebacteria bacterium]
LSIAAAFLLSSSSLFAWGSRTHIKIVSDAYHIMPKAFREFLGEVSSPKLKKPALKPLAEAAVEPDKVLKDFQNHIFHIQGYNMGKGPFHIEELVNQTAEMIEKNQSKKDIIQKLGWIGHYASDLVQPLHTGVSLDENIEEKSYHSATEKDADKHIMEYGVNFDGCTNVKRVSARMIYEALWANQYYDALESAYTSGKRYEEAKPTTAACYSRAVNNVVDLWYTIWIKSGHKPGPNDGKPKYYPPAQKIR